MKLTEKQFQATVVNLATILGWGPIYHTFDSRRSNPGFPDLVLLRGGELIFAELKTDTGKLTDAQKRWIASLRLVRERLTRITGQDDRLPIEVHIWRPRDWEALQARLQRKVAA